VNHVILSPNGEARDDRGRPVEDLLPALGRAVRLDEGFCLADYFRLLENHPVLVRLNEFLPDQLERFGEAAPPDRRPGGPDHLEFFRTVEMVGYPEPPRLDIYVSLTGIAGGERVAIQNYSFDGLLDVRVSLGGVKHIVFGDRVDVFEFAAVFTLFEFIDGIALALSVQGGPDSCAIGR
jgi:hypothetical protein